MSGKILIFNNIVFVLLLMGCNQPVDHKIDYDALRQELLHDSSIAHKKELINLIVDFYQKELPNHYSQRVSIRSGRSLINLDELTDRQIDSIRDHLGSNTHIRVQNVNDSQFVDEAFLARRIRHSLQSAEKYPWNESIPDSIFLNYLLPYKIMDEYPGPWWEYLEPHYQDSMAWWSSPTFDRFDVSNSREVQHFTTFIMGELPIWWSYDAIAQTYTPFPSLKEILLLRYGGCQMEAMINSMILRTWGIPATVDEVPHWGAQNGSHTADVVWNAREGRMDGGADFYFVDTRRRAAKVIRHSFRKTDAYTKYIAPLVTEEEFQIPQMRSDHWFDVTAEHGPAADVVYPTGADWPENRKFGYIYVMNFGNWVPTSYGAIENDSLRFGQMGIDIVYRVGYYASGEHHLITPPFLLDQDGEIQFASPDENHRIEFNASKINHGAKAGVEQGNTYTLRYLDQVGNWKDHSTRQCEKDEELWFKDVPSDTFYMLHSPSERWGLARMFLVDANGEQVWY